MKLQLEAALVAAAVVAVGWLVSHFLTRRREDEARRLEGALRHLQRQIEELYGPLDGLIRLSAAVYDVALNVLPTADDGKRLDFSRFSPEDYVVWEYLQDEYFLPLKSRMVEVLRTKLHLLESGEMPRSFDEFLTHQAASESLYRLHRDRKMDRWSRVPMGWPRQFGEDVARSLARLQASQMEYLKRIRPRQAPRPAPATGAAGASPPAPALAR